MARLRSLREAAGLTQSGLAVRAGVSRQMVGAVEAGRHLPRVDAAIALARVLGVEVADLFGSNELSVDVVSGAPPPEGSVVRLGWVGDRILSAAARVGTDGWGSADAVVEEGRLVRFHDVPPGVVVAGCEPALETLEHLLRERGMGALAVSTSSAAALEALSRGRVHAAVVHGPPGGLPQPPDEEVVRIRLAVWRVGVAVPRGSGSSWWRRVLAGELEVVQREQGAAVQRSFEHSVGGAGVGGPRAGGHLEAARHGMAAGLPAVTIEPAALAVGADFRALDRHEAELWVRRNWMAEKGLQAMLDAIGSTRFRRRLQGIGGYELEGTGTRVA